MKPYQSPLILLCLVVFLLFSPAIFADKSAAVESLPPGGEFVRAGIGIEIRSDNQIKCAKSHDNLKKDDLLRVHILPEQTCYIYIIHTDQQTATLVNPENNNIEEAMPYAIPSSRNFFQVDGQSAMENISIICSPQKNRNIIDLFCSGTTSHDRWSRLKTALMEKSKIDFNEIPRKSISLAGNLRGASTHQDSDFTDRLKYFSGKSLLVKTYEFHVEK
jgi:hypothetical protein